MSYLTWTDFIPKRSSGCKYYLLSFLGTALKKTTEIGLAIQTSEKHLISIIFLKILLVAEDLSVHNHKWTGT